MTPRRLQSNTRLWCYRFLVLRDGERCARCFEDFSATNNNSATKNPLEIDHINGNPYDWHPDNIRLLCKSCNITLRNLTPHPDAVNSATCERERAEGKAQTRVVRQALDYRSPDAPTTLQANFLYELDFRKWIITYIREHGDITKNDAIAAGAEVVGCSPLTAARYLSKLTSSAGPFHEVRDMMGETSIELKEKLKESPTIQIDLDKLMESRTSVPRQEGDEHAPKRML